MCVFDSLRCLSDVDIFTIAVKSSKENNPSLSPSLSFLFLSSTHPSRSLARLSFHVNNWFRQWHKVDEELPFARLFCANMTL